MEKVAETEMNSSLCQSQQPPNLLSQQFNEAQTRHPALYNIQGNLQTINQQSFYPNMVSAQQLRMRPNFEQGALYARPISIDNLKNSSVQWSSGAAPATFFTTPTNQMASSAPPNDQQQFGAMFYKQARPASPYFTGHQESARPPYIDASTALRPGHVIISRGQNNAFPLRLSFQHQPPMHRDVVRLAADNIGSWSSQSNDVHSEATSGTQLANGLERRKGGVKVAGSGVCTSPISDYETDHSLPSSSVNISSPATKSHLIDSGTPTGQFMDDSCSRDAHPASVASAASGQSDEMLLPDSSHQPLTLSARKSEKQVGMKEVYDKMASLGDEADRSSFLTQLFNYMKARTTPITAIPIICRQAVDLYKLYHVVRQFGGMMQVTKMKQWRDVSSSMGFGGSSSAGFTLKRNYCRFLFPYECKFDRNDMDPTPIIAAMETTSKKESSGSKKKDKDQNYDSLDGYTNNDNYFYDQSENSSIVDTQNQLENFNGDGFFSHKKLIGDGISKEHGKYVNGIVNASNQDVNQQISSTNNDVAKLTGYRATNHQAYRHLASAIDSQISSSTPDTANSKQEVSHITLKRELNFPEDSIETAKPKQFKRRKLSHKDIGSTDLWRVMLALRSGELCESTWALDVLNVLTYDPATTTYFNLTIMTGLLELLTEHLQHALSLIFEEFRDPTPVIVKQEVPDDVDLIAAFKPESEKQVIRSLRRRCTLTVEHVEDADVSNFNLSSEKVSEFEFSSRQSHLIVRNSSFKNECKKLFFGPHYEAVSKYNASLGPKDGQDLVDQKSQEMNKRLEENMDEDAEEKFDKLVSMFSNEMCEEPIEPEPLIFQQLEEWQDALAKRCICISNILRNLASVDGNEAVMARHYALVSIIAKLLLLHHQHNDHNSAKYNIGSEDEADNEQVHQHLDWWWWDTLIQMRERCLIILASISHRIDLTIISETSCTLLCRGLAHWLVCRSSQALDAVSSQSVCLQRLALESLCRLAILADNVEIFVATQPFHHLACALDRLVENIASPHPEATREMAIDLLLRLARMEGGSPACLMGMGARGQRSVALLIDFVEEAERHARQQSQPGQASSDEGGEALLRVCELLQRTTRVLQRRTIVQRHCDRLLQLVMSESLGSKVVQLLAEIVSLLQ